MFLTPCFHCYRLQPAMRSLEVAAPWQEEEEDVEVDDMELRKHSINGRDDLTESSSDEATGRKIARRKNGGNRIRSFGSVIFSEVKTLFLQNQVVHWFIHK